MWGSDCHGCDPDLVYHLEGCPLAGELRGKLWLDKPSASDLHEQELADHYQRGYDVATERARSRQVLGLPI